MRLFVAVKPDRKTLDALVFMQNQIKNQGVRGNYTPLSNIHVTLAFIGEYNDPAKVLEIMKTIPFSPFELYADGIGNFGDLYYASLKISDNINSYVGQLRASFDKAGIPYDKKKFTPHVTLLRRADRPVLRGFDAKSPVSAADRVILMRSDRGNAGMIYTEIGAVKARATR